MTRFELAIIDDVGIETTDQVKRRLERMTRFELATSTVRQSVALGGWFRDRR